MRQGALALSRGDGPTFRTVNPLSHIAISDILHREKQRAFSKNPVVPSADRHNIDARNADRKYRRDPREVSAV